MIELFVEVPQDTPHDARLFLAGNLPRLGHWRPDGLALERLSDGRYHTRLNVPADTLIEFLVTRGSWREVESNGDQRPIRPRHFVTAEHTTATITVAGWGRKSVRYHHNFPSRWLKNRRSIIVHLPPEYGLDPTRRYPVFYLQDGQNLFDASTAFGGNPWRADETAERLTRAGEIEPVILVGIANTSDRMAEYGPKPKHGKVTDRSRRYGRFVVEEVKPFIDRRYRTRPEREHTAIGGSSLGGLIALVLTQKYTNVFSMCAALSPSLWWERVMFLRNLRGRRDWFKKVRFWIDTGDREGMNPQSCERQVQYARQLVGLLKDEGLIDGIDFRYLEVIGGEHNEHAWAGRFDQVLRLFFGPAAGETNASPSPQ